ncbi:hypothetical protein Trydic_g541 [Trypoxylus dichotomus]
MKGANVFEDAYERASNLTNAGRCWDDVQGITRIRLDTHLPTRVAEEALAIRYFALKPRAKSYIVIWTPPNAADIT